MDLNLIADYINSNKEGTNLSAFTAQVIENLISLTIKGDDIWHSIGFMCLPSDGNILCHKFGCSISHVDLENMISTVMVESEIRGKIATGEIGSSLTSKHFFSNREYYSSDIDYSMDMQITLKSESDIPELFHSLKFMYIEYFEEFFQKCSDLDFIYDHIRDMPLRDSSLNFGTDGVFRKPLIMYLLGNDQAISVADDLIATYTRNVAANPDNELARKWLAASQVTKRLISN